MIINGTLGTLYAEVCQSVASCFYNLSWLDDFVQASTCLDGTMQAKLILHYWWHGLGLWGLPVISHLLATLWNISKLLCIKNLFICPLSSSCQHEDIDS